MKIKLDENYYIEIDEHTYNLMYIDTVKSKDSKNFGNEIVKPYGYFSSLKGAVERYIRQNHIDDDVVVTLREYVELVEKENKELFERLGL